MLCEYDAFDGAFEQWYAYGNYIDEVLIKGTTNTYTSFKYYIHDHLYSPVAITNQFGLVVERYEYDAYGNPHALDPTTYAERLLSGSLSRYLFTGRELDIFDSGSLKIQYNRNRYYDSYTGRWTTQDPRGVTPGYPHIFSPGDQYEDGINLYEYVGNTPTTSVDPYGFCTAMTYSTRDVERSVRTRGICPPLITSVAAKKRVDKFLREHKSGAFDTCPEGQHCTGGSVWTGVPNRLKAKLTESFWWLPLWGRHRSIIAWVKCEVTVKLAATIESSLRIGGTCCPD